ncbi:hypothetical protein UXN85_20635 [Enterobacter hormaechei]
MSKDILDSKRTPVNKVAARVMAKGEHFITSKRMASQGDSDFPLPMLEEWQLDAGRKTQADLMVGKKVGRFTVLGIAVHQPSNSAGGLRFVLRCSCGTYTYRRSKAIRNPANMYVDCCERCRELLHLKRNEHWRRTGKDIEINSVD